MPKSHLGDLITWAKKQKKNLVFINEIKETCQQILGDEYTDKKCYKLLYHLKNKGFIISLKKDIFCLSEPENIDSEEELITKWYRTILDHHLQQFGKKHYIGGIKALELHWGNYDIPDEILIVTEKKQCFDTIVPGKIMHCKKYTAQGKSLFSEFLPYTKKIKKEKSSFLIACKELAILEALFSYDEIADRYTIEYIKKILKKYELDTDLLESIIKIGKHHTSLNRLLELVKVVRPKQVEAITQIIKKWSFIISV